MKVDAIVGANYGDEAKGLFTDYLAQHNSVVIRYNGGAQAGHTVVTPNGVRHIFSHFCAGTFKGAASHLSQFFVCNPILFNREQQLLAAKGVYPQVSIDPRCIVTTPYDMLINQVVEKHRNLKRHGSCGIGFGETIERNTTELFKLTIQDLFNDTSLRKKLKIIAQEYVPFRLNKIMDADIDAFTWKILYSEDVIKNYLNDCENFIKSIKISGVPKTEHIIFEGAQGLLLDQDHINFPYVTRSNTGSKNILSIMDELNLDTVDVYYATRSYVTRHGAGPLDNEIPVAPYSKIEDKTNVPNDYQGTLRFAPLDLNVLEGAINADIGCNDRIIPHLAMSCLDQLNQAGRIIQDGETFYVPKVDFFDNVVSRISFEDSSSLESWGPTRNDIRRNDGRTNIDMRILRA